MQFEDITAKAGVGGKRGWKTGVSIADVNGDGLLDIYVCYSGPLDRAQRANELFINNGNLTFTEEAGKMGIADSGYSTQAVFFDYDRDGDLDLFVINHNNKNLRNFDAAFVKKMVDPDADYTLVHKEDESNGSEGSQISYRCARAVAPRRGHPGRCGEGHPRTEGPQRRHRKVVRRPAHDEGRRHGRQGSRARR